MLKLNLKNVPAHLEAGIAALSEEALPVVFSDDGIPVTVRRGDCLRALLTETEGEIVLSKDVELFRAIAHLAREGIGCRIEEHASFRTNGLMLDASRNGVQKPEAVRFLLRRMALMGLDFMMLYTEDTFEVEGYPYFGYQRGGYKKAELKALDDYAYALGIEMIPCIQTLGHHGKILRWGRAMGKITDTADVLLVGEEETYRYIKQLLKDASAPYRSKRIHIGMDEAGGLGKGAYRRKHGDRPQNEIFSEHIARVGEICDRLGLKPMIWSDMYFAWPTGKNDYDPEFALPADMKIPGNMEIVYWDYYHHKQEFYEGVIDRHTETGAHTLFGGGLWNWTTPSVNTTFMLSTSVPGLRASKAKGLDEVFTTAWNDCGAMCPLPAILFGLQLYAEFDYTGEYTPEQLDARFAFLNHADAKGYRALGMFNMVPGSSIDDELPPDCSAWLFWEDPLGLYFEKDLLGLPIHAHYEKLYTECRRCHAEAAVPEQVQLWEFYERFADLLVKKTDWRENVPSIVRRKDRVAAQRYARLADETEEALRAFHECWYGIWHTYLSDFGWDVIDLRVGGLTARWHTAARTMHCFADGTLETIPQIDCEKLPYAPNMSWFYGQFGGRPAHFGMWAPAATNQDL